MKAIVRVYPGKKSRKGMPMIIRVTSDGKNEISATRRNVSKLTGISPLPRLIFKQEPLIMPVSQLNIGEWLKPLDVNSLV
jgi:hypothetical protein